VVPRCKRDNTRKVAGSTAPSHLVPHHGFSTREVIIMRAKLLNITAALAIGLAMLQATTGVGMTMEPDQTALDCRWVRGKGLVCHPESYAAMTPFDSQAHGTQPQI
jgi:hypothetical protein